MQYPFQRASDTPATHAVKWEVWRWLWQQQGCRRIGFEVKLRQDVGVIWDVVGVEHGHVWAVEVKTSRADFLKDCPPIEKVEKWERERPRRIDLSEALCEYVPKAQRAVMKYRGTLGLDYGGYSACHRCPGMNWLREAKEAVMRAAYKHPP